MTDQAAMTATPTAPDPSAIQRFLELLFPDELHDGLAISETRSLVLWDKRGTIWVDDPERAVSTVENYARSGDAYFHTCLHSWPELVEAHRADGKDASRTRSRGAAASASMAPGCWADVDHVSPGHKRADLAPDLDAILVELDRFPIKPSVVVATGGGAHAYWLFTDPYELTSDEHRQRVYSANHRLQTALRAQLAARDWGGVDHTHDLARILRVPGTINWKYRDEEDGPRPVVFVRGGEGEVPRYTVEQVEEVLPAIPTPLWSASTTLKPIEGGHEAATFKLRMDGKVPERLAYMLAEMADPVFVDTWMRRRVIQGRGKGANPLKDDTASEYTLSLAARMIGISADWTDQELADAIMAWRVKHGELIKDGRPMKPDDLVRRTQLTIAKVRAGRAVYADGTANVAEGDNEAASVAIGAIMQRAEEIRTGTAEPVRPETDEHTELLARASAAVGTALRRVERIERDGGSGDCDYWLILESGARVCVGGADALMNPMKVRSKLLDVAGVMIRRYKGPQWDPIALILRELAVDVEMPSVAETDQEILLEYLSRVSIAAHPEAAEGPRPFVQPSTGRVVIRTSHLATWVAMGGGPRISARGWTQRLRAARLGEPKLVRQGERRVRGFVLRWSLKQAQALAGIGAGGAASEAGA